jgi:hypothetical protein
LNDPASAHHVFAAQPFDGFRRKTHLAQDFVGVLSEYGWLCLSQTYWLAVDRESGDADL